MHSPAFLAIRIGIDPVAFSLGPLDVHWYGIGYVVALTVAMQFALRYADRRGLNSDIVWDVGIAAILMGFIGGRLYYVVQSDFGSYLEEPWRMFEVWRGGMAFFGALFAVVATVVFFAWWKKYPLAPMLDVTAIVGLIGQTIGRLGNVVNGDVIGPPTDLPWGFIYTHPDSFAPDTTTAYHPASVYAIIGNLVLIAILLPLRHRFAPGWFAIAYVGGYCLAAMAVFYWRSEPVIALGLRQAQWTALAVLAATAVVAFWYWRRGHAVFQPSRAARRSDS